MNALIERAARAFNAGARDEAKALCMAQLSRDSRDPDALLILGHINAVEGDTGAAAALLSRAAEAAPPDAGFFSRLGTAWSLANLDAAARKAFESALAIEPGFVRALHGLGNVLFRGGDWAAARGMFERALARQPDFAPAIAALADLAFRENRDAEAHALATRAAALSPDAPAVQLILADIALSRGQPDDAIAAVDRVFSTSNPQQQALAENVRGRALERLGRFEEAFAAFGRANERVRKLYAHVDFSRHPLSPPAFERMIEFVRSQDVASWPAPSRTSSPDPVFLVGFPRSGTTLLGQVLGAHPDIETLEENDSLADAVSALLGEAPIAPWSGLTSEDVDRLRDAYWNRVEERWGRIPAKPVVIDKMPMNLALLPVIRLLFPRAKILLAIRDPRDVVISCFKQHFVFNHATAQFLSLSTTVSYFDVVMRLAGAARRHLPIDVCELKYEHLTANFAATAESALTFLGAPWNDLVLDYADSARGSRILTPSARAVTKPVYTTASGAWRNYAAQLAPHMTVLEKWAGLLGYEPADAPQ